MSSPKQEDQAYSEPEYAISDRAKTDFPYYLPNIEKYLIPETRNLLESYSKVPLEQQVQHVHEIRDQAWAVRSYACTGLGVWLIPYISRSPAYSTIMKRLQTGDTLMDVGCFLGGDLRRLACDGAPSDKMYGVDIVSHWEVGYALYRDKGRFDAKFIEANILSDDPTLMALKGRIDVISVSSVIHQWRWEGQIEVAKKLVAFSKPGSLVVGYQIGNEKGREIMVRALRMRVWRHDPTSFEKMWSVVGAETNTTWKTKAWLRSWAEMGWDPKDQSFLEPGDMAIDFVVTRIH